MIQCRYCGRPCGCRYDDPCVCGDLCPDCDVKPDDWDEYNDDEDGDWDEYGGES